MKTQIRRGIFETNSSSVHSLTIVDENEYLRWRNGEMYFRDNELIDKEIVMSEFEHSDAENFDYFLEDYDYKAFEDYWDDAREYENTFEENYTTKNKDNIVAFGYSGYN